jgi:UDP-N-acetyl-2-amino-2-deoxyglucuronate dehydrogenase
MAKIRFGVIGCGRIFAKHLKVFEALNSDLELAAVCDTNPERLKSASSQAKVPGFTTVEEMLQKVDLDAVSILTWSGNHATIASTCAGKVENIIVEKPMALRLKDADDLIEKCARTGTRLFVVKQNRYNPPVAALKKAAEAGRFGRLLMGTVRVRWCRMPEYYSQDPWRGTWAMDGGVLTNQASHHIDLLTWIMGPVESVFAKTETFLSPIEAEDTGVAILKFRSGALGLIEATTCARPKDLEGSISILGENGSVEVGGFAVNQMKTWQFKPEVPGDREVFSLSTNPESVYGFGHLDFMKDVIGCIREGRPAMIDGLEGRRSLELINAIYESVEQSREVFLSFRPQRCRLGEATRSL